MPNITLNPPLLGFLVGTRAALAFGAGLLLSSRIPESRRRRIGWTLVGVGAATTIPAIRAIVHHSRRESATRRPESREAMAPA
ncbi:MAG TPA: hypothetical protein VFX12_09755 [Vicinamibacterales bacterium]|nr:hypothetical protein [Vicinamibacterales bacterium]